MIRTTDSIEDLVLAGCCLTIGSYDGIHLGHQHVIHQLLAAARARRKPSVVLSFYPHPSIVLKGRKPAYYLTSPEEKAYLLDQLGVDYLITMRFDRQLSTLHAHEFLDKIVSYLHPVDMWVGPDFAFGYEREGDVAFLREVGGSYGFGLHIVEPMSFGGQPVSSTRVRAALRDGDVVLAASLLGRKFDLPGRASRSGPLGPEDELRRVQLTHWSERAVPVGGWYACHLKTSLGAAAVVAHLPDQLPEGESEPAAVTCYVGSSFRIDQGEQVTLSFLDRLGSLGSDEDSVDFVDTVLSHIDRTPRPEQ